MNESHNTRTQQQEHSARAKEARLQQVMSHMNASRHVLMSHVTYERVTSHMNDLCDHITHELTSNSTQHGQKKPAYSESCHI